MFRLPHHFVSYAEMLDPVTDWITLRIAGKAIDSGCEKLFRKIFSQKTPNIDHKYSDKMRDILNKRFSNEVNIFSFVWKEPTINIQGRLVLSAGEEELRQKHLLEINGGNRPNDPHAILAEDASWYSLATALQVQTLDFAAVRALRELGKRPKIISAGAVLVCGETEELILHQRSENSDTYPGQLHILGGAYVPDGFGTADPDRGGLVATTKREIFEETQASISAEMKPPMILAEELQTGFIQLVYLGWPVSKTECENLSSNWEGKVLRVPFSRLADILREPTWVPSGKCHVLAWLGLGAPNAKRGQKFSKFKAKSLFESFVGS